MDDNFVTIRTVLDYNETEQEFRKLLNRLNSETTIRIKIETPNLNEKNSLSKLFSQFETIKKSYENYGQKFANAGQKSCLFAY